MRESRGYVLDGRKVTRMLYAENRNDLFPYLEAYGPDVFLLVESDASKLFPHKSLPAKFMIADPEGEQMDLDSVMEVIVNAKNIGVKPRDRWIVVGNGPVMELGSLASLFYYGGAPLTLVPTTLFAMTDGAIGGKCGINYPGERHLCFTSHPADEVIIDVDLLNFQKEGDLRNGFGAVIRNAFLSSDSFLTDFIMDNSGNIRNVSPQALIEVLERAIAVKLDYMEDDPDGTGKAKALELGNRFSYGFSLEEEGRRNHGNAAIWGMAKALMFGLEYGITDPEFARRGLSLIRRFNFDMDYRMNRSTVMQYVSSYFTDPKTGKMEMIVPRNQGDLVTVGTGLGNLFKLLC